MSENRTYCLPHPLELGMGEQAILTAFGYGSYQRVWVNQNLENLDHNLERKPYVNEVEINFSIR